MPTNRVRISRNKLPEISPTAWARLNDEPMPEDYRRFELFKLDYPTERRQQCEALWSQHREEILSGWCNEKPGTRPSYWWIFDAPRLPEDQHGDYAGWSIAWQLIAPRLRIGGKGTPAHEVLGIAPCFEFGIPMRWVDAWQIDYYNGRALDVHGSPIGENYSEGDLIAEYFGANDPPRYESQATYLKRHGLLMPGEASRIKKAQFLPESLPREYWPDTKNSSADAERLLAKH